MRDICPFCYINLQSQTSHLVALGHNPLTASFDELVQHHAYVSQCKAADKESKKLCRMPNAEL